MTAIRTQVAVTAALAVLTLTAGCIGGLSADGSVDAAAVGETVEQRYAALDGYEATVTRTVDVDGTTTAEARATVTVRDEQRAVEYTAGPRAGETVEVSADEPVFGAGASSDGPGTAAGYGALAEALVRTSDVSVERVTRHDGHRTAVVALQPRENATGDVANLTRTVWVDLDRAIPLKVVTSWTTAAGQEATMTVAYDDVSLVENQSASAEVAA
jgi:outer membrane lipoprotein-sorting protein